MARRKQDRAIKSPSITIIGEGMTERFYFIHMKRQNGYRYVCKPRNFAQQSLEEMQKQIERVLADKGVAVCVFDADTIREKSAERKKFEAMQQRYKDKSDVLFCDSMPSIEFWFLIHYLNTNRHFESSAAVIQVLRKYIADFQKHEGFLKNEKWVQEMQDNGGLQKAIEWAKTMPGESYSNIYKVFEILDIKD